MEADLEIDDPQSSMIKVRYFPVDMEFNPALINTAVKIRGYPSHPVKPRKLEVIHK